MESAWHLVSRAKRYCCSRIVFCSFRCAWSTRLLRYLKGQLADVPRVVAWNISLNLWLEIGVKHVVFLELWLIITSLELWLELASVVGVSVHVTACTDGSN